MRFFFGIAAIGICALELVSAYGGKPLSSFNDSSPGSIPLASPGLTPTIVVSQSDFWGVQRAANDLALDFGRVAGSNGTLLNITGSALPAGHQSLIVVGTVDSPLIANLVSSNNINVSAIVGQWEAFQTQLVQNPTPGVAQALVIVGADKRGTIYGVYDLSRQIGVSPWYFWADVPTIQQDVIYALPTTKVSKSPSIKYRGIFLNDEAPALTNWVETNFPAGKYGPGFNVNFYELVFELLLRLRANYIWPASWNSMFYVDDILDGPTADAWGIVMGTSHTEPLARATKEQSLFLNGPWSWQNNQENVTDFMRYGVDRAHEWETLWTMGMRGLGDTSSPTLTAPQLEQIVQVQQQLLMQGLNTSDLEKVPQMWCIYKEVGGYYQQGLQIPDDVTILWADDNWMNPERLPLQNETKRSAGSGVYWHFDYVGNPRNYKWINTMNLPYVHEKLTQAYDRSARQIWIFNVGDLKPLEIPINFGMDMAFDIDSYHAANATLAWTEDWATQNYGPTLAPQIAQLMMNYSLLAGRRKYELMDIDFFSLINYNEFDIVMQQWYNQVISAESIYNQLPTNAQASFFEMILHPSLAGMTIYQIYYDSAKNNLYAEQGRTSANQYIFQVFDDVAADANLTLTYNSLLNGKWAHMMDQTHFGYDNYWQQPMRNSLPGSLSYVQTQLQAIPGVMGVSVEGGNGTIPGDDQYHTNGGQSLTLPPMDPFMSMPSRWIDVFSRSVSTPINFYVNTTVPYVQASTVSGTLQAMGSPNQTDIRIYITVDWANAPPGNMELSMTIATSSGGEYPFNQSYPYGPQYSTPTILLCLNNTASQLPSSFSGFVQSDGIVSIEPEHFSVNKTNEAASAYYAIIPGYGRTLSGVTLLPPTAPVQQPNSSEAPVLQYNFYTFDEAPVNASVTVSIGATLNTVSIDDSAIQYVRPIPVTVLGSYGVQWTNMVSNFSTYNTTTQPNVTAGPHTLNLWAVTPSITFQKVVIDFGGLRPSYLGPPESLRVNVPD